MNEALVRDIVHKHFGIPSDALANRLKSFAHEIIDLSRVCTIEEMRESGMLEERETPHGVRLHIAGQVLAGLVAGGAQNETVCSQLAISMADALLFAHRETIQKFEEQYARAN